MSRKFAFVFPGQGSQSVAMLSELAAIYPVIGDTYQEASDYLGYDLGALVKEGPEALLNQTERTQPALLAASVGLWRLWSQQGGPMPVYLAGHSLGEYSALVCAQALDFAAAISLVALRGRLMQEAVPEGTGAMAAIVGLDDTMVAQICWEAAQNEVLSIANYNAIGQVVIAGNTAAVLRAIELAKKTGAKMAKQIPVSVPSHCALMEPASQKLSDYLQTVNVAKPQLLVLNNVDVACYFEPEQLRSALVRQLYQSVRWVESMQRLLQLEVTQVVECGPGKVLAGLNKRIDAQIVTFSLASPGGFEETLIKLGG